MLFFICSPCCVTGTICGFNTSHVILYPHLPYFRRAICSGFNTSHVILYLLRYLRVASTIQVSIHLMLFFIKTLAKDVGKSIVFQYISCYSLSDLWGETEGGKTGFNTSHVILYLKDYVSSPTLSAFQYISCYSLSKAKEGEADGEHVSIHLMLFFIDKDLYCNRHKRSFNTSHVILYQLTLTLINFMK